MPRLALKTKRQLELLPAEDIKAVMTKKKKEELVHAMAELLLVTAKALERAKEEVDVGFAEKDHG